uniref:Cysteine sulfoxide lyase n=1 Tax=Lentinula edodes TaxID=5353 RepID=A0A8K1XYC6_LENED|nr:cysteine sulfoxide lyase [Lentinula edodes]
MNVKQDDNTYSNLPAFGNGMLSYFCLDPLYINLNSGSFGCLPKFVHLAYNDLSQELEAMPDLFIRRNMKTRVDEIRAMLAGLCNTEINHCVIVPNVAHGITTVLRNFPWRENDKLIMASTTFHTISRTVECLTYLNPHPSVIKLELLFPASHEDILESFHSCIKTQKALDSSTAIDTPGEFNTVVLFDSIVSMPGVKLPWKKMVQICKEEGVWSLIDAAHSLGQELDINLGQIEPDFWISSCNKWLYSKRGCALLHVPLRNQTLIKHSFPPGLGSLSLSNHGVTPFVGEFHWNGSTDVITALTIKSALEFRASIGGEERIIRYCHSLAIHGGQYLANILQTKVMESPSRYPNELIGSMVNVALPLSGNIKPSPNILRQFDQALLDNKIYASIFHHNELWWTRISVQIFTEIRDFEKLGEVLIPLCAKIQEDT